eukprot:jgi/Chrzof1/9137/Cz03g37090.t1
MLCAVPEWLVNVETFQNPTVFLKVWLLLPCHCQHTKQAGHNVRASVCLLPLATHICSCQRTTGAGAMHPYTSLTECSVSTSTAAM